MSSDYVLDVKDRLGAAQSYIDDFARKSKEFFNTNPNKIVCEIEPKGTLNVVLRYRFVVERAVPASLRVPITGCVAELRPILDHLVYGLSQISGMNPSCGIKFPVYGKEASPNSKEQTFETWVRNNKGILSKFPAGAVDLVHHLQPFNHYKGTQVGPSHPIHLLNRLSNQDKHKMSLKVTGVNKDGPIHLSRSDGRPLTIGAGTTFQANKTLEHNSIILEMTMPASQPIDSFKVSAITYVAFDKNSPAPNAPVYEFLVNMHDFVRDEVIAKFEPFFPT